MSPRTQSQNLCILVYLLFTKMEVVERSGRQEGALTLSPLEDFGVPGNGKSYPTLWSLKEFHISIPHRPVHTNPHTQTHMHGGNKYFPYQRSPSLIPQVGSKRGGVKCSVFQGWGRAAGERKGLTLSPFAGWKFISEFLLEERVRGNHLFLSKLQATFSQVEAESGAVSLK